MKNQGEPFKVTEMAWLMFFICLGLISWPFLLSIERLSAEFLFYYFFTVWFLFIIGLFFVTRKYTAADDNPKKEPDSHV